MSGRELMLIPCCCGGLQDDEQCQGCAKRSALHRVYQESIEAQVGQMAQRFDRYKEALEAIKRHHDMPDGESWEQAYSEVCAMAVEALEL